ncbi:MAG: hypothetical protein E6J10_10430 [Chloroflexi bacterium]|nr:MAG: hypothetical protein E6J10_10430 [Chloroflexota bacterium]
MINQPEIQEPNPQQEKLVLPPPDGNESSTPGSSLHHTQVRPEDLIRPAAMPPKDPLARLIYFWRKDPAYKVLIIAVGLVLIAGLLSFSLVSRAMNPNFFKLNSTSPQAPPTGVTPSGTVDLRPAFPSPGGGQGSSTSSQPPAQSTPALQPTVDNTQSSPTPGQGGTLTVQITGIPNRVQNGSVVDVGVSTNEANVTVELYVVYSAPPYRDFAGPHMTGDGGNATIPWSVSVYKIGGARATVVAIARDQNGQQAQSQPVSVQIAGFGGG